MVSFAELAESRRSNVERVILPSVTRVHRLLPDGEPDFWCSGFLLRLGQELVLISAGHALMEQRAALILDSGRVALLANSVVLGADTLQYAAPINDVGTILLSSAEAAEVHSTSLAPLSAIAPFEHQTPGLAYVTMGYRANRQIFDHSKRMLHHQASSVMVSPAPMVVNGKHLFPPDQALLLDAIPSSFRTPQGRGGVPKFRGMSGSPVWRFNPQDAYSLQNMPPLVAMMIGESPTSKKALLSIRMAVILEHLSLAYPHLAPQLPSFSLAAS